MFGAEPGAEQTQGKLNQHVVTKLSTWKQTLWVFHKRGEQPRSVYIQDLTKRGVKAEDVATAMYAIRVEETLTNLYDFEREKDVSIVKWGTKIGAWTLGEAVAAARESCMLGYIMHEVDDAG